MMADAKRLLCRAWPPVLKARRWIAVLGLARSGTSWLAKALSLADGVHYTFEPDYRLVDYNYRYLRASDPDEAPRALVRRTFRGRVCDPYSTAEQAFGDVLRRPLAGTVLAKFVRLCLAADLIADEIPDVTVVQVVRHPAPLFVSWRARGWDPRHALAHLRAQQALMAGPLAPFADSLVDDGDFWRAAGRFWGAVATLQLAQQRPGWILKEHEWYCEDPLPRIRWLVESLGLTWNARIEAFLGGRLVRQGPGYGAWRDPKTEIDKWRGRVSAVELEQLREGLAPFGLPFYPALEARATLADASGMV